MLIHTSEAGSIESKIFSINLFVVLFPTRVVDKRVKVESHFISPLLTLRSSPDTGLKGTWRAFPHF